MGDVGRRCPLPEHPSSLLRRPDNSSQARAAVRRIVSSNCRSFTHAERAFIERHRTPWQVQRYLNRLPYNGETQGETLRSFRSVLRLGTAHCLEAALTAAVVLEEHGYPPLLLDLASADKLDHVLFLYRRKGLWGTVARSRDPGLHGRKPVFPSVRKLVESYAEPYVDYTGRIVGYAVANLAELGSYDWRLSDLNMWKVEYYLNEIPHQRFHTAERTYRRWLNRYLAYKKRYPERKPLFYPNRRTWMPGYPKTA